MAPARRLELRTLWLTGRSSEAFLRVGKHFFWLKTRSDWEAGGVGAGRDGDNPSCLTAWHYKLPQKGWGKRPINLRIFGAAFFWEAIIWRSSVGSRKGKAPIHHRFLCPKTYNREIVFYFSDIRSPFIAFWRLLSVSVRFWKAFWGVV